MPLIIRRLKTERLHKKKKRLRTMAAKPDESLELLLADLRLWSEDRARLAGERILSESKNQSESVAKEF